MSEAPKKRFPFSQWIQYRVDSGQSYDQTSLPGDTTQDLIKISDADPETFGKVTLANSLLFEKIDSNTQDIVHIFDEPYNKIAHLQSPALYSGDLVGATKIEIVTKFKVKQYPPLGSNYATIQTIPVNVDPYLMVRFFNSLSDPDWAGSFNDDAFLISAYGGLPSMLQVAPGWGFSRKIHLSQPFFPTHVPCHGKVFSNGVSILGTDLTDGSEIAAVDAMKEYRLDITGKDYNFIQYLQGTINISQVTVKSAITQDMIVDLYGVWIEVTYAAKPSHGSSLLSSAG